MYDLLFLPFLVCVLFACTTVRLCTIRLAACALSVQITLVCARVRAVHLDTCIWLLSLPWCQCVFAPYFMARAYFCAAGLCIFAGRCKLKKRGNCGKILLQYAFVYSAQLKTVTSLFCGLPSNSWRLPENRENFFMWLSSFLLCLPENRRNIFQ